MITDDVTIIRLLLATLLGGIIGFERQHRKKTAGLRTHILVSLGACLVAIISVNTYGSVQGFTNADPARLAAQVVSGIGFLGAGTIMKEGPTIKGLTTAASLWVVASVGLAIGMGYLVGGIVTSIIVILALDVLPRLEDMSCDDEASSTVKLRIHSEDVPGQLGRIGAYLGENGISVCQIQIEKISQAYIDIPVTIELFERSMLSQVIEDIGKLQGVEAVFEE
jgi:putative Mg2+ transporter-C (MgtC) family protein